MQKSKEKMILLTTHKIMQFGQRCMEICLMLVGMLLAMTLQEILAREIKRLKTVRYTYGCPRKSNESLFGKKFKVNFVT